MLATVAMAVAAPLLVGSESSDCSMSLSKTKPLRDSNYIYMWVRDVMVGALGWILDRNLVNQNVL